MTKKMTSMFVFILLIVSIIPGRVMGATVTLKLNMNSAPVGNTISASGSADKYSWVSIKVLDSNQSIIFYDAVKSNSSGNYVYSLKVPDVPVGVTLTVVAGYGSNVASQTLTVTAPGNIVTPPVVVPPGNSGNNASSALPAVTGSNGVASINPKAGGTVGLGTDAFVEIPAGALNENYAVEVKVQKAISPPAVPAGFKLASYVYDFSIGNQRKYRFAKPVMINFAFSVSNIEANEVVAIYYYDESLSEWKSIGGKISRSTITAQVNHFTKFAVLATSATQPAVQPAVNKAVISLNDVAGSWAETNINKLITAGAIGGYPDGSFKPDEPITRAEFVVVLVKAFNLEPQGGRVFSDTASHWAKNYITTAVANKIVNGYSDTNFGPNDLITREQMAVMIVKAAKLTGRTGGKVFTDQAQISSWAQDAVVIASANNTITGYPDNRFKPQISASRAEAVTVITKTL